MKFFKLCMAGVSVLALGGCAGGFDLGAASDVFRRDPIAVPSIDRQTPDARGVITYETYQVVVARAGDTITTLANRVGISPESLARHNGLPLTYAPNTGEVLALPVNVGGAVAAGPSGWSEDIAVSAIENAGGSSGSVGSPTDPIRHRVESGDTAYSIARQYNVSVTALASWNGLGPDLAVRPGQQLIIPVPDTSIAATPPATPPAATPPATTAVAPPQPPASTTTTATATPPAATTPPPAASTARFSQPVDGTVARGYSASNEGINYSARAGAEVRAAAAGTIALISNSTGGLGTIVLVRHDDNFITVYARVADVKVSQGQSVSAGQVIAVVAPADNPTLHFEVRRGNTAVDPA
ncbi:LysM peptidoglycan-binding domain-containing protein, partial [Abyssibius alkaniclasticus]|uniref:LysM peptidoglycan-binding domain-containing protein n=1 Tax=Abyssibius alkaniclasticus TaxID=2881234 RepID=UPI00405976E5